jgi:hypothetical protein
LQQVRGDEDLLHVPAGAAAQHDFTEHLGAVNVNTEDVIIHSESELR